MEMAFQKYKGIIPVLVLACLCIWTIVVSILWNHTLGLKEYGAYAAVIVTLLIFFAFRPFYKYVLLLTLLLGLINLINFGPFDGTIKFSIGSISIRVQTVSFFLCILTYITNFEKINEIFLLHFGTTPEQSERYEEQVRAEQIGKYKKRYSDYSDELLNNILTENKYAPEALAAARQILNERQPKEQ